MGYRSPTSPPVQSSVDYESGYEYSPALHSHYQQHHQHQHQQQQQNPYSQSSYAPLSPLSNASSPAQTPAQLATTTSGAYVNTTLNRAVLATNESYGSTVRSNARSASGVTSDPVKPPRHPNHFSRSYNQQQQTQSQYQKQILSTSALSDDNIDFEYDSESKSPYMLSSINSANSAKTQRYQLTSPIINQQHAQTQTQSPPLYAEQPPMNKEGYSLRSYPVNKAISSTVVGSAKSNPTYEYGGGGVSGSSPNALIDGSSAAEYGYKSLDYKSTESPFRAGEGGGAGGSGGFIDTSFDEPREATEEQLENFRHIADIVPKAAFFIVFTELCERFAYYGVSALFQNYVELQYNSVKGNNQGGLDRGPQVATALTTFFGFWTYLTPVFGAIIADQFLGKFRTIVIASVMYAIGLSLLTVSSLPVFIDQDGPKLVATIGFIVSIIIIGIGTGGIKSNISAMVAEQQRQIRPYVKVLPSGERVVVNPGMTVQRIFNWFYWSINVGSLSSIPTTIIEKWINFWPAYLIPTAVFALGMMVFIAGNRYYRHVAPTGSIMMLAGQAVKLGLKRSREAAAAGLRLVHTQGQYRPGRLDWAKPSTFRPAEKAELQVQWNDIFIDELKRTLKACKVFLFFPIYWVCYMQITNNLVSQASVMNSGKLPNDLMQNINPIVLIIFIPIFDLWIYPQLARLNINFRPISRITAGFICGALSMAYSAITQARIYSIYQQDHGPNQYPTSESTANISIWWQSPSYALISISEIFALITGLEYAFNKAPASMKAVVVSLFMLTGCFGAILNYAFIPLVQDPHLTLMYAIIAGITAVLAVAFRIIFRDYDREEVMENVIGRN
ncbi:PTR2-domain-containing protein [Ramicandelaber brevisporus]|nr:PTR2-domain-containing protein [Ramicandelaber brevisporus]